ncbi:MAG: PD-(D/E)XK motif protein [Verrucomicrobiaceae bacterium]
MTVSETLKQTWAAVVAEAPQADGCYHRRMPLACAWPAHAGIHRPTDACILVLEIEHKAVRDLHLKDETKGYSIDVGADDAGRSDRATIRVQETSAVYREIFTIFCTDILEHWIPHTSASDALKSLNRRLARWKKFFQRGAQFGLNREDYIGLYGELFFIEAALKAGVESVPIVNAWQAPLGTNQDFLFGPVAVEIKTTTANDSEKVRITNGRQLDSTGLQGLFLAHNLFDFRKSGGRTLPQLVATLKSSLAAVSSDASSLFDDILLEAGFVDGRPNEFDGWGFTLRRFDVFAVEEGFPRLLESSLPPGVSEVSYALNLSSAQSFQVAEHDLWANVISTYG